MKHCNQCGQEIGKWEEGTEKNVCIWCERENNKAPTLDDLRINGELTD